MAVRHIFFAGSLAVTALIALISILWPPILWAWIVVGPLILLGFYDAFQKKRTLLRIYPILGRGRYWMEIVRPEIQQYFVENNIDGTPINREMRSIIYQRAKGDLDTLPFGTQRDVNQIGYEWMNHSLYPKPKKKGEPRIKIGNEQCSKPYMASHLNISAMSFGSLGSHAIMALNRGAKKAGFYHNTGEGGISQYHLKYGGDLVWQVGTGYFGCRAPHGTFDAEQFEKNARREEVKMVELKISQGAKPSHGGILPGVKVTEEIARARGVVPGKSVESPPGHSAFEGPEGLLRFLAKLRELSGGKPVGFKLCLGDPVEFMEIVRAMLDLRIYPDFITVDGAEGGTGAAPLEFSNSVGMPMREGLVFVHNALRGAGIREKIRVIAAGKIVTGFQIFKTLALGADLCNSARGMMISIGCIQARRCNENTCPTGVATQDPVRNRALNIDDKFQRAARYHQATVRIFLELVAAAGLDSPEEIHPHHVLCKVDLTTVKTFEDLYPQIPSACFLTDSIPAPYDRYWQLSSRQLA